MIAAELQRRDLAIWLCDDELMTAANEQPVDKGEGMKPVGYYISSSYGLFPAPLPNNSQQMNRAVKLFHFLGTFIAKALQDNRLVDLPLSQPLLKLISRAGASIKLDSNNTFLITGNMVEEDETISSSISPISDDDLLARFLQQLNELVQQKQRILSDTSLTWEDRNNQIRNLCIPLAQAQLPVRLDDLGLTFQYCPPSRVFGYSAVDLKPNGELEDVTIDNVEEYVELMMDFILHTGIKKQMDAFRDGLNQVFPIDRLSSFTPEEVRLMLCGEQSPNWTREDIIKFTEPKLGYTRESPGFLRFVNVLVAMKGDERKSFLQFATGCSSLPPGGLAILKPNGELEDVTIDNVEEYVELMMDFILHTGIKKQMDAFRDGLNQVFPIDRLSSFTPEEVRLMLCGEQSPNWTREDIIKFTEPKLGYTRESPGFLRFVNVLVAMKGDERKSFLQFATGCSSLPPGGLANLHPRLTIVRKVDASEHSYPSVNTCAHYLKLPDYSNEEIMREKLLAATKEKGFHLN
ncbi:unnamed protein product [Medioppia subpectinata]|uniref:E3 ubiquitin-protein ligase n=1 Tax=Medioppia subpectinata TaxID=1979941 RepID=A0A7R9L7M3_9ACAR|nr:unnamed protein product [Medioppia subpectinata]CAG2116677.1 unnamed protein product [Medioppia subpectinata]